MSKSKKMPNSKDVREIHHAIKGLMGPGFMKLMEEYGVDTEKAISFLILGRYLKEERERRSLSLKEVTTVTKIPQYRLRAIENASVSKVTPDHLKKYISFLEIEDLAREWAEKNPEVGREFGLENSQD
jgi:hypothetical protein